MTRDINLRYVDETFDPNGLLKTFSVHYPDNFNFGYDIVDDIAVNDPNRRALVWCDDKGHEKIFTFADIKRLSDKTANYLTSKGVKKGDMVLVILKHNYQFWYVSVALHKMGAVMIPATYMLTKHDIEYRINSASVKAAIVTSDAPVYNEFLKAENIPTLKFKAITNVEWNGPVEGFDDFDKGVEEASEDWKKVNTHVRDMMLIYFTSGTSGNPKMAVHDFSYPIGHILTAKHWHCVVPDGLHWSVAETGWAKNAWGKLYGQWIMEAAVFVYEYDGRFEPKTVLDLIEKYRITTFCCPPTMFRMYCNAGLEGHDLSSLVHTNIAGEALNSDTFDKWYQATGLKLMEGFGQSESTVIVGNLRGMEPKPGSMGRPSPQYKVDIIDPDGKSCPPGTVGEIVVGIEPHPAGIFIGYYRDRIKTRETLFGGFHHTGDLAWKDEDGYYWYVGRNDDVIKSSGYRISPFEIESVLLKHPCCLECAVTAVPDEVRGQIVKASIVLRDGFEPSDELKKELQNFVKHETAPYKYPRAVEFVKELPKSVSGKIKRVDIRNKDKAEFAEKRGEKK
jgi:acetyl-CoA synthetase